MGKKIAVLGTGATGCSVGADLTQAGYDVVLIDQWPAHVEAMKSKGLRITMPDEELHQSVRAYHLCEVCSLNPQWDIVLLTAKSYDSCWMTEFIKPYLKPDGALVSLQNSLNDEWIAPIIGFTRDIGCVVELSAEVFSPGIVQRNTTRKGTWFGLGELHGRITPRLGEIREILNCVGRTSLTTNIWGAKWTKLIANSMMQAPIGILGLYEWEAAEIPQVGTGRGTGRCFRVNLWVLLFFPKNPAQNSIFLTPSRKGRQGLLWQFLSSLICCTLFPQLKADFLGRLFRRSHQLADSIKYDLELGIIFLLQRFKFASQLNTRLGGKSALFWATLILTVHNPFGSTNDGSSKCLPDHTLTNTPT